MTSEAGNWEKMNGIQALSIACGVDGSIAFVSPTLAYPRALDYKIYVVQQDGSTKYVGDGINVAIYNVKNLIFSNSFGHAYMVTGK